MTRGPTGRPKLCLGPIWAWAQVGPRPKRIEKHMKLNIHVPLYMTLIAMGHSMHS